MGADTRQSGTVGRARLAAPGSLLILLLLVVPAFVDVPSLVGIGPLSGMGALTMFEAGITALAVLACRKYPRRLVYCLAPYGMFLIWASSSVLWTRPSFGGLQNWTVYALFGLVILLTGTLTARYPRAMERTIDGGVRWMDRIALTLVVLCLTLRGLPSDDAPWLMGARAFALLGLLPLSWHVAQWNSGRHRSGLLAWLWVTAIGLSLSRTATAVGLMYLGSAFLLQLRWNVRFLLLRVPAVAVATLITLMVLALATPMAERLFTGDTSIELGGVAVNASGRMSIWPAVIESAWRAPVAGQGLGSSMEAAATVDGVGHPHNDYLRVWHDLGFIGLAAFCFAFAVMLVVLVRKWRRSEASGDPSAPTHLAALLGITGVLIACATDNAIIYPYVMTPLGVLVGAALGVRVYDSTVGGRVQESYPWRS
jgi:O-antigen ligase